MREHSSDNPKMPDLIPASMLSDFTYCPRQCYIRYNEGEFVQCEDVSEGTASAASSDSATVRLPEEGALASPRPIHLSAPRLGITCRINLIDGGGGGRDRCSGGRDVIPILLKKGEAANISGEVYDSDRVRLCAQGLVLQENGFFCSEGLAYFSKSRKAASVQFDEPLIQKTRETIIQIRVMAEERKMPPPLVDSPKCNRCSFGGICLPDEINLLREKREGAEEPGKTLRMLLPGRDDEVPVYVLDQGSTVHKHGDCLEIRSREGRTETLRMREISQLCLYGGVEISTPAVVELMQRGIPVLHFTHGGWFEGICLGHTNKNIDLRIRQFESAKDSSRSLSFAKSMISGKIRNCRTLLRRNDQQIAGEVLDRLGEYAAEAEAADSFERLLGVEGAAAELYFSRLGCILRAEEEGLSFHGRNRRPPRDPVNAVLSYLYGILAKECFVTLLSVGFEPYLGFYHQPRYGRPALALDMMEEFRPLIADSTAVSLFNNKELAMKDFVITDEAVMIRPSAKRKVVGGYERRMDTKITHPLFGYKVSYRRVLEIQSRLLSRSLFEEIDGYPAFCTR